MKLSLVTRLAVQDVRPVPYPLGPDIVFHIARIGVREYQEFAEKHLQGNPLYEATVRAQASAQLVAPPPSEEAIEKARAEGKADQVAKLEEQKQRYLDALAKAAEREGDRMTVSGINAQTPKVIDAIAKYLIRNIDGLTDEESGTPVPVKYSPKVGIELLSSTVPIDRPIWNYEEKDANDQPTKLADVNTPLGVALRAWVLHEASKAEAYRAAVTEEAAKN